MAKAKAGANPPSCVVVAGSDGGLMLFDETTFTVGPNMVLTTLDCVGAQDAGDPTCLADTSMYGIYFNNVTSSDIAINLTGPVAEVHGFTLTIDAGAVMSPQSARLVEAFGPGCVIESMQFSCNPGNNNESAVIAEPGASVIANQLQMFNCNYGVGLEEVVNLRLTNTLISGSTYAGIALTPPGYDGGLVIDNCQVTQTSGAIGIGIELFGGSSQTVSITNSEVDTSAGTGLYLQGPLQIVAFSGNAFHDNGSNIAAQISVGAPKWVDGGLEPVGGAELHLGDVPQLCQGGPPNVIYDYASNLGLHVDSAAPDAGLAVLTGNTQWEFGGTASDFSGAVQVVSVAFSDGGFAATVDGGGLDYGQCVSGGFVSSGG